MTYPAPGSLPRLADEHTRYPTAFIDVWRLRDGTRLTLRPVLPQDASLLGKLVTELSPASRSNRFHGAIQGLSQVELKSMSCIDYARTGVRDHVGGQEPRRAGDRGCALRG